MNRTLYQFPLSHYCEKARWLLDFKDLDYKVTNLFPGAHRVLTVWKANSTTVPTLNDGQEWIGDSTEMAFYLDAKYVLRPLLPSDPEQRRQAIILEEKADKAGIHVRRWAYSQLLATPQVTDLLFDDYPLIKPFKKPLAPFIRRGIAQMYQVNPEKGAQSFAKMMMMAEEFETVLLKNGGRYLVGHHLGLADIAVASLYAPLMTIPETPWASLHASTEAVQQLQHELSARPLGQWLLRLYREERHARGNWRGQ
ncbi:glutathione S-transferase family protein [Agitococcus lubricus]|uniref:Glutathione S-transferase n=1 Tax=Agitococcus lubricus TaxID=1077255 RepID=A0A2T5ITQ0_9GAMM|nr:glutathione S-transferase family protein [Agitococcus lubricus]PTQ87215.1 glutathione S-transferase [Agitococcus lubricus]